ncbi:MAG: heparinase, partial [Dysgonamonadaceae bacterium]
MMSKKIIILILLSFSILKVNAYSEKNLLQKAATAEQIKSALILNQKWVPYPNYKDRSGWDKLMGNFKSEYIQKGEQALNYNWIVIKATDYLDYERTGTRTTMESPYGKNIQTITDLLLAELTEGEGRFIDQLINGVFYTCEMTSWSIAAHQVRQSNGRSLPLKDEHLIELTSGDVGSLFSWIYFFFQDEFDKV